MTDAKYFREQAQFCLEMARQMSDRNAAASFREMAARHQQRALELEATTQADKSPQRH
jgi:hypothetical protein